MLDIGAHILADLYGCQRLDEIQFLKDLILGAVAESGATILHSYFQPHGLTGVVVGTEPYLAFHTWIEQALQPKRISKTVLVRGSDLARC